MKVIHCPGTHNLAFGLLEIIIVLAIVAITMIAATQAALVAQRAIKKNEIGDLANGLMIQALEVAKSPTDVRLANVSLPNVDGSYAMDSLSGLPSMRKVADVSTPITPGQCTSASPYSQELGAEWGGSSPLICLQVVVREISNLGLNVFEITAHVLYKLEGEADFVEKSIIGYRRNSFQV